MAVNAKFYVAEVTKFGYSGSQTNRRKVVLVATSRKDEDSRKFFAATPSGRIELELSADEGQKAGLWFEERIGQSVILTFEDAIDQ